VKHAATPWYVVCLQALKQNRQPLTKYQRFTLSFAPSDAVHEAHRSFRLQRDRWRITNLEDIKDSAGETFFVFSDLNYNWWEITSAEQ
jgi:hypothetical protein